MLHAFCRYLQGVLQCVCKGLSDPDQNVRNTALFAIGQFSEHLQVRYNRTLDWSNPRDSINMVLTIIIQLLIRI